MNPQDLINRALTIYTPKELAKHLAVDQKTIRRWQLGETKPAPLYLQVVQEQLLPKANRSSGSSKFTFIDLFAGIGGIRTAFEKEGGHCVFTSEWDPYARKTYSANFHDDEGHIFADDITKVEAESVPDHDMLLAGFPCQPFSIAGVSKKNALGRAHGFEDKTQGTLFFDVARIIKAKRPKAFLLENVKNLVSHDKGRTFATIMDVLKNDLKYHVWHKVINARHFGPQRRERIIIVGFREEVPFSWEDLELPDIETAPKMGSVLHREDGSERDEWPSISGPKGKVLEKYTLSDKLWEYLRNYAAKHREKGNGFGFGLVTKDSTCRTLSARYYKDGSEILVSQGDKKNPRRLTPRECARLMGFDDSFRIPVSDTRAYKQFGNSVVVPVISSVAKIMAPHLVKDAASEPAKAKKKAKA